LLPKVIKVNVDHPFGIGARSAAPNKRLKESSAAVILTKDFHDALGVARKEVENESLVNDNIPKNHTNLSDSNDGKTLFECLNRETKKAFPKIDSNFFHSGVSLETVETAYKKAVSNKG